LHLLRGKREKGERRREKGEGRKEKGEKQKSGGYSPPFQRRGARRAGWFHEGVSREARWGS